MASEQAGCTEVGSSTVDTTVSVSTEKVLRPYLEPLLEFLKEDGVYMALADHFSRQGRGRRPILPNISTLTNGLLIQLHLIKEQQHATFRELKTWLEALFDDTASVTEGRITHRIYTLLDQCEKMSLDDSKALMLEPYSFHTLSPPLADLALNRLHLTDMKEYSRDDRRVITNEVVIHLEKFRHSEKLTPIFVRKWVNILCSCSNLTDSKIRTRVTKVIKTYKSLQNKKKCHELNEFLSKPFSSESENITQFPPTKSKSCDECKLLQNAIVTCKADCETLQEEKKKLKTVIRNERDNDETVKELSKALRNTEEKCEMLAEKLEDVKTSKLYKKNHDYKKNIRQLKKDNVQKEHELELERGENDELIKNLNECKAKIKHEQTMKSKYKTSLVEERAKNSDLSKMLSFDNDKDSINLRQYGSSHRYSNDVRQAFYALQGEGNVAAEKCSMVVETVAKHIFKTDIEKNDLPCSSTSLNFANEAYVIAKYQAVDEIKNSDSFTYASDGTSRQKSNFLEQHIILSNGKQLSLGFSEIARDNSETLLEKCVSLFKDMCEIYCLDDDDVDGNELLKDIIRKMTCLLSDRASVNKAFNQKMSKYKEELLEGEDCTVYFTFCNAHFLLALSAAAEKALQSVEQEVISGGGGKLGRDSCSKFATFSSATECASFRLIRLAAEVLGPRGDEKSGCRKEWLVFCSAKGIKSTFSSFRTNRFNNLFQNATALLRHRFEIELFLNENVSHNNLKLQSIVADLQDTRIITLISVLSYLHVCITEPYWQLMNSTKSYADFPYYVQKMKVLFDLMSSCNFIPNCESLSSVFDEQLIASESDIFVVKQFLNCDSFKLPPFLSCLNEIVIECNHAVTRQLSDFLAGGTFGDSLSEDVRNILSTCPLTNLTGERLFGDLDYCMNKRRNASLILRSTTNMWKRNKTERWLNSQSPTLTLSLMERAIKYGPEWKKRSVQEKKKVDDEIKERLEENKRKKDETAVKLAERKNAALDAIIDGGGHIVTTKDELDRLYSGPKSVERIKDQIRFRNLVRGEKITLTGNKKVLYERLLCHISK